MKDILKKQEIIQMVSFYVEGQLYLLPVAGIQEVLRHMELVKIPLAPHFVAGAINFARQGNSACLSFLIVEQ